jgi:hypothetical protein
MKGRSTISFLPSVISSSGLRLKVVETAERDQNTGESSSGFAIGRSDLKFTLVDGRLTKFDGGSMSHMGGFTLTSGRGSIDASGFSVAPSTTENGGLELRVGKGGNVAFNLENPRPLYQVDQKQLMVSQMDMVVSMAGAQQLGRPDLEGKVIGALSIYGDAEPIDGEGDIVVPEGDTTGGGEDAPIDVSISAMSSLQSVGRVGTFPNGVNGLSMSTTSCNVGSNNIPWFEPMNVQHPVIAMNLYRVLNGRFEQVGWSWLKHGFFATNSAGCGTCQHPGTGSLLGPGCSDTYGVFNNSDRNYLGGRDEVNPFTGVWTCQNSYFSNYVNDCVRRNNGAGLDAAAHRLEVQDADMGNAGATYYYEAYYINANDFDKYNNCASRVVNSMTWTGSAWSISNSTTAQVQGPAINRWGEMRGTAVPQTEGDVIVAVQTTNLGSGVWRYEYAVYNHDLDRQIREFSVPVPPGASVTNIGFRDVDQVSTNQWNGAVNSGKVMWSTGVFGSTGANPLKYSSVFNFRFDANVPPANGTATLGLFKPGSGTELKAVSKTPLTLSPLTSMQTFNGFLAGGNLQSLELSDDNRVEVSETSRGSRAAGVGIVGTMTAPSATVNSLTVGVESKNTLPATANPVQTIQLWNWTTSAWETLDTRPTALTDSLAVVAVTANASRFVNASTREVQIRIFHKNTVAGATTRWRAGFDQVGMQFN